MATKVLDVPLAPYTPAPICARIESSEYQTLRESVDQSRARREWAHQHPRHPQRAHAAHDAFKSAINQVRDYRLTTAALIDQGTEEADFTPPEGVALVGEAETGTAQWLQMRQAYLGGSDVGAICRVGNFGRSDYDQVRARKVEQNPQDQRHEGFPLIGDLWEPLLVCIAQEVLRVEMFTNKGTFSDGARHVNLDAFTLDQDGTIDAVVECKTSSNPADWASDAPAGYVLQVQHYMDVMGAKTGYIVANLNDSRLVVYRVDLTDTVPAGPDSVNQIGDRFSYTDVKDYAFSLIEKWNHARKNAPESAHHPRARTTVTDELVVSWGEALGRGMVFIDIETTTLNARTGHVLEMALVGDDGARMHLMFGVPDDHAYWNGTGEERVHGISLDDVAGHPVLLHSPDVHAKITEFMAGRVAVAHYARFEEAWLTEAGLMLDYADTRDAFSAWVDTDEPDNTMSSLCSWAGVPYQDAHRAMSDTLMMKAACERLLPIVRAAVQQSVSVAA